MLGEGAVDLYKMYSWYWSFSMVWMHVPPLHSVVFSYGFDVLFEGLFWSMVYRYDRHLTRNCRLAAATSRLAFSCRRHASLKH